jgi:hypothetical protein
MNESSPTQAVRNKIVKNTRENKTIKNTRVFIIEDRCSGCIGGEKKYSGYYLMAGCSGCAQYFYYPK